MPGRAEVKVSLSPTAEIRASKTCDAWKLASMVQDANKYNARKNEFWTRYAPEILQINELLI